ncbi:unnamed protein product [Urochloa decumbens]|uniref:chitinase n=1 Tax=Urochloa decumbens TaxID=240449 RepID=A0ABC9E403_9POAL
MMRALAAVAMLATAFAVTARAEQCGVQVGGTRCPSCLCCSSWGWCGSSEAYCGAGCQSQCTACGSGVGSIVSQSLFDQMLLHRNDSACPAKGFYTYAAFIAAANSFHGFGTTGSLDTQKREVAVFLAQTSHETTGGFGWPTAPDGPYSWGYCFKEENGGGAGADYCQPSTRWPCAAGKKYYGRGPVKISYNYNYGPAGQAIGQNLLGNPDLVATDATVSFKTAIWFWMTPQSPKPSSQDVITGQWTPTIADVFVGRLPGYGLITNIINGGHECGHGVNSLVTDRIGFYMRYCDILGVSYGANLDCYSQRPFGS